MLPTPARGFLMLIITQLLKDDQPDELIIFQSAIMKVDYEARGSRQHMLRLSLFEGVS